MTATPPQVVVGAGLNGLMVADLLSEHGPVVVLEAASRVGGLLGSFDYGPHGRFDYGTHIFAETGNSALDSYIQALLPAGDWIHLRGHRRNFAGRVFNGRIQTHTMYPDITSLPEGAYESCMANLPGDDEGSDEATTAYDYLLRRYGREIAERVGRPIVEGFAKAPAEHLHPMVIRLCPLDRLAMFDRTTTHRRAGEPQLRQRLAYVDQRDLPASEQSSLASFYPRRRGIGQAVEALEKRLRDRGVDIRLGTRIESVTRNDRGVELRTAGADDILAERVYWTANALTLAVPAGIAVDYGAMDRPRTVAICNLVVAEANGLGDVHFIQVADPSHATYRYTNYDAFCAERHPDGVAVTVELLVDEPMAAEELLGLALEEMASIGITTGPPDVRFSAVEVLPYGFPRPTLANVAAIAEARRQIEAKLGDAVTMLGVGSADGRFFMTDVLEAAYTTVATTTQQRAHTNR